MKRKTLVTIHLTAAIVATLTISTFFVSSVVAEINGTEALIKKVKQVIFLALPILLIVMPALGITGNKLAGKSKNPVILSKQRRMKFIVMNGIILISLACFLYYRSLYETIDDVFLIFQFLEFSFGLLNLTLIGMNIKSGLQLSGRWKQRNIIQSHEISTKKIFE